MFKRAMHCLKKEGVCTGSSEISMGDNVIIRLQITNNFRIPHRKFMLRELPKHDPYPNSPSNERYKLDELL